MVAVGIVDPVETLVSLIDTNYATGTDASTTVTGSNGGSKPTIDESWDLGKQNIKNVDLVRVYEIAGNHYPQAMGSGLDRGIWRISIDMATSKDRNRLRQLYGEVVRVLRSSRNSPGTNYNYVKPVSRTDQTDKLRRWYRYVLDVELISYEAI
jgi:hypothetical protein|tara:strand:+ start:115 stop:573 length:459 start_codon:yes stop_codon:yes gene_type:complete